MRHSAAHSRLLPAPLIPIIPYISPSSIFNETSLSASSFPSEVSKVLVRCFISIIYFTPHKIGTTITVAASPAPHKEILDVAKEILAAKGVTLDIKEFTDYVQPNNVVENGEIDANYFQHTPYLDDFNKENGTHIVSVAVIHVEPMGLYGGKQTTLDALDK